MLSLRNMPQYLVRLLVPAGPQPLVFSMRACGQHPAFASACLFMDCSVRDPTTKRLATESSRLRISSKTRRACGTGRRTATGAVSAVRRRSRSLDTRAVLRFAEMLADGPHQLNLRLLHRMTDLLGLEFAFVRVGRGLH